MYCCGNVWSLHTCTADRNLRNKQIVLLQKQIAPFTIEKNTL